MVRNLSLLLIVFAAASFSACNLGVSERVDESKEESFTPKNLYEGTGFSIVVTGFDIDKSKTTGEVRNGFEKAVREFKGYLYFVDENGDDITFSNGSIKREPFQRVQNPFIVDAKRTSAVSFGNRIDKRAANVYAVVTEIIFTDGTREAFD